MNNLRLENVSTAYSITEYPNSNDELLLVQYGNPPHKWYFGKVLSGMCEVHGDLSFRTPRILFKSYTRFDARQITKTEIKERFMKTTDSPSVESDVPVRVNGEIRHAKN